MLWMKKLIHSFCIGCLLLTGAAIPVQAEDNLKQAVDQLNQNVKDKRQRVQEIDGLIQQYHDRIQSQDQKQANLENELLLLDNRVQEKELEILRSKTEIEALTLEIAQLETQLKKEEEKIQTQKELIADLIRRLHQSDEVKMIDVFLTRPSLSSFFDRIEELKQLQGNLTETLEGIKKEKTQIAATKQQRDEHRTDIQKQQLALRKEQQSLELEKNFKTSLIAETQRSQQEYERVLEELRQQQQTTSEDIFKLEEQLKDKLDDVDRSLARGDVLLNWPLDSARMISAHFHDPTYPFRDKFQHPGIDLPTSVGTVVHAAAGGYVAWTKKGSAYGNYLMIVHPGGIATIYAHLSKFIAKSDTYVERGQIIGLSGGRPGDPGAGLSTGPHLHFEVRQNGIPVDPENFLPDVPEEE